jgi:hypothetical protein
VVLIGPSHVAQMLAHEASHLFSDLLGPPINSESGYIGSCVQIERGRVARAADEVGRLVQAEYAEREARARVAAECRKEPTWPSPEALVRLYHAQTPDECPTVTTLSAARRTKARQYLAAFPDEAWWAEVFARIHRSRFLRGRRAR